MDTNDTIAAISTPPGRGGIGVVRISGPRSLEIARAVFRSQSSDEIARARRACFGQIIDPVTQERLDTAVLTYFCAPNSYTGTDVVEISCHGSPPVLKCLLESVGSLGARMAEPGEFTMRAFLNKKLDLTQAQAVRDLIEAQTTYQARLATRQMEGALSKRLAPLKQSLVDVIVHLESAVEFVEDDISPESRTLLHKNVEEIVAGLVAVADSFSFGRYVKQGFDLAIVGRPNVGKSSLFNRLAGADRAIVTEHAGTTRDALYESVAIGGLPVRLIDTAGIRETIDPVESIGVGRARTAIADADISLLVLDNSEPLGPDDAALLDHVGHESRIVVLNKVDLPARIGMASLDGYTQDCIRVSALTGAGFESLTQAIFARLGGGASAERDDIMVTDARQYQALRCTIEELTGGLNLMDAGEFEEVIVLRLKAGLAALGEVTGETLTEDILARIFSTFCIGK